MQKIVDIALKVVLCLMLVTPILGALGIFPPPTAEMYNTPEAFAFIETLMSSGYIMYLMALVFLAAIVLIVTKRMAFAALLITPITVNIVAFHLFLDGGLFTAGAVMGNILLLINAYFLWQNRTQYASLMNKK